MHQHTTKRPQPFLQWDSGGRETENELVEKSNVEVDIVFILGNCCDQKLINNLFKEYRIEILIHCAAYKHVPLVEINPIIGLANNILSTKILTDAAINLHSQNYK